LVLAVETEAGARLNEALVNELTGGDRIRARRMREDFWEFDPTHKFLMATNHKPKIRGNDYGIWRRLKLVPFVVTFPPDQQDKELGAKLRTEDEGILAWLVRGCHWSVKYKLRKAAAQVLGVHKMLANVPDAHGKRRLSVKVTWTGSRVPDLDSVDKLFLDACKEAHLILDDDARGLDGRLPVEFRRGREKLTEIVLEDVP
jgi:hypothetical protein